MINFIETRIVSLRPIWLASMLLLIAFVKAGIWHIPNTRILTLLAKNPFRNPFEGDNQYLFSNWLVGFLAWLVHAQDDNKFILLNVIYSCIFLTITLFSLRLTLRDEEWRKSICIFICLPVSWTHFYRVGYDSLTLALIAVVLSGLRLPPLTFVAGIGLGLAHQTQGIFAMTWLLLATIAIKDERPDGRKYVVGSAVALGGVLTGSVVLRLIIWANDIHLDYDRTNWLSDHLKEMVKNNAAACWTFAYCLLGPAWLIILRRHGSTRLTLLLAAAILASAMLTFVTDDITRVFGILSYPVIAFCLLYNQRWLARISNGEVATVLSVWIVAPWLFSWAGRVRTSLFVYDVAAASHAVLGWPGPVHPSILHR